MAVSTKACRFVLFSRHDRGESPNRYLTHPALTLQLRLMIAAFALLFLGAHLTRLPTTLGDWDSVNFALAVESFDIERHRPHPPGYPVFVAMTRASTWALTTVAPGMDRDRRAAVGLAIWGAAAGALAVFIFTQFWRAAGLVPSVAVVASLLAIASPLFWLTANRSLTDMPGFVAAVGVQTLLVQGLAAIRRGDSAVPRAWIWGAFSAGVIVGLRSQTIWLTGPLLCVAIGVLLVHRRPGHAAAVAGVAAAGVLLWAVPLVWTTGGVTKYLAAVRTQGGEDLAGIELLTTSPSWRLFTSSLQRTFIGPWQIRTLAHVICGLALIGLGGLAWRRSRTLGIIALAFLPYVLFHFMFQEAANVRYGLPIVVPVAGLAVAALALVGPRTAMVGGLALTAVSLVVADARLSAFARGGAPVFRAFHDMQSILDSTPEPPLVKMHHQVWWGLRRVIDWYRPVWDLGPQPFPGDREWLDVVEHFRTGGTRPVWFLAHVPRTDLAAAFDSRTTTLSGRYEMTPQIRSLVGSSRLDSLNWWSIERPGWMLGPGWSLTPELAGMTSADDGQHRSGATAFILRQPGPLRLDHRRPLPRQRQRPGRPRLGGAR